MISVFTPSTNQYQVKKIWAKGIEPTFPEGRKPQNIIVVGDSFVCTICEIIEVGKVAQFIRENKKPVITSRILHILPIKNREDGYILVTENSKYELIEVANKSNRGLKPFWSSLLKKIKSG